MSLPSSWDGPKHSSHGHSSLGYIATCELWNLRQPAQDCKWANMESRRGQQRWLASLPRHTGSQGKGCPASSVRCPSKICLHCLHNVSCLRRRRDTCNMLNLGETWRTMMKHDSFESKFQRWEKERSSFRKRDRTSLQPSQQGTARAAEYFGLLRGRCTAKWPQQKCAQKESEQMNACSRLSAACKLKLGI